MDIPTLITALTLTCHVNGYTSVQQWRYKYRYRVMLVNSVAMYQVLGDTVIPFTPGA